MSTVKQVGGDHYKDSAGVCPHCGGEIQHWDWAGGLPGLVYAATKYIARFRSKDGLEGLLKAISCVEKMAHRYYPTEYTELLAARKNPPVIPLAK